MRCASRTPPRRPEAGDPSSDSQDSPPQARGSKGRTTRSKRVPPAGRDCHSSEDLRASRKEEGHRENVAGAGGPARAKRRFKVSGTMFEVDTKYELIKPIGHGAYGVVISALNNENGQKVAIKKITRAFDDLVDAKRILREITLLRKFSHDNIISIVDILVPPSPEEFEDVYIVSDLMETDLHRIINSKQELTPDHVQYFLYQILRALKYMHSSNVLHRDLKPSNLLLNSNCDLKVCDLGLARDIESGCQELTEYVVTRWYRAPEIMLACQEYSKAIDVWSVGCIFAELMLRRPFFPGDNYIDQLTIICDKLGKPKEDELAFVSTDKARRFILKLSATTPRRLRDHFPETASEDALDLLSKMLEFSPKTRISVEDALRHPFLQSLHAAKEEPIANFEFCFAFEAEEPSKHRLQELMWEEMRRYHPEQGPWKGKKRPPAAGQVTGSPRVFAGLREGAPSAAPLGRSPIKAGPVKGEVGASSTGAAEVTPSDGGAEKSTPIEAGKGDDSTGGKSTDGSGLAAARITGQATAAAAAAAATATAVAAPHRRTSSRAASLASTARAAGKGRSSATVVDPGVATPVPTGPAQTAAPRPRGNGSPPVLSSSALSGGDAPDDGDDDDVPRARTRATARARVIKGRTTVLAPAQGRSSRGTRSGVVGGGSGAAGGKPPPARWAPAAAAAAAAAAAPIAEASPAKSKTVAVQKRQRRGKPAGEDTGGSAMPCAETRTGRQAAGGAILSTHSTSGGGGGGRRGCRLEAPAEGSSESLLEGGFGHDPPGAAPNLFGKRKLAHQAGRAGEVGLVVPGPTKTGSTEEAT